MFGVEFVGSLSPNFNAHDRLSCANDSLDDFFDLIRDLRNSFADRSPDMIGDRDSADFCQTMIDLHIAKVWGEERKAYRRGIINELKLRRWFVPLPAAQRRFHHLRSPESARMATAQSAILYTALLSTRKHVEQSLSASISRRRSRNSGLY